MTREPTPAPHIPDYELLREIGRGSYGTVWLARSVTGLFRAVKIVWRGTFDDPQPYEREFRGIKEFAAVSLIEPRQLALLHVGRNDAEGFFYYVMELADDANTGRDIDPEKYVPFTLRELRSRRPRLPADEALTLAVDLAGALAGLHAHKLVHRDIKPSNIIFAGGVPKLADIGLVTSAATAAVTISRVGNPGYMPPDFPGTPSADAYGLGKVLYEITTGRDRDDYPRLPADLDKLPDRKALLELNEIFVRACAPDPVRRYTSAAALRDDLLLLQAGKSLRRLRAAEKRLRQALRAAAILGIAAGLAAAAAWLATRQMRAEVALRAEAEKQRDEFMRKSVYVASLALAQRAIEQNDLGRAIQLLDAIKPAEGQRDWRGFEWRALRHAAKGDPSLVVRRAGSSGVQKIALSPDNELLAVLDAANHLTTYRTRTGAEIARIAGVLRLAGFSPEGDWLVGATNARREGKLVAALQRWRVSDGAADQPLFPGGSFRVLGTRRQGQVVIFADATAARRNPMASIWDFNARREIRALELGDASTPAEWRSLRAVAAPGGEEALVAFVQGQTPDVRYRVSHLWLGDEPSFQHSTPSTRPGALGFLPQAGRNLAWIADPSRGEVAIFDPAPAQWRPAEDQLPVANLLTAFTRGNVTLLAAGQNSTIALAHPAKPGTPLARAHAHAAPIVDLAVTADGARLFSASADGEVRAWETAQLFRNRRKRDGWDIRNTHTPITYSADGRRLYVPGDSEHVIGLDADTLEPLHPIERMRHAIAAQPGIVWGLHADRKALVRWEEGARRATDVGRSEASIVQAAISPNLRFVCFSRANGQICFGSTDSLELETIEGDFASVWTLQLSDDCRRLWCIDAHRHLTCHALPSGEKLWTRPLTSGVVSSMHRSPGTGDLFVGVEDGTVHVFDAATGARRRILSSGGRAVEGVQILPDRSRLLVVDLDGDVHAFETEGWSRLGLVSTDARNKPYSFAVSPDSRQLAFLTVTGTLHVIRTE